MDLWAEIAAYLGIAGGVFLEGEIVLIGSIVSAQNGVLPLWGVVFSAFLGTVFSDWFYFFLGRKFGVRFLQKRVQDKAKLDKARHWIQTYPVGIILIGRFMYGFRTIIPMLCGISHIRTFKFLSINLISILVWMSLFGSLGYYAGHLIQAHWETISTWRNYIVLFVLVIILLIIAYRKLPRYFGARQNNQAE